MGRVLKIINGELYDPLNSVEGAVKEICIQGGKIVPSCTETPEVLDARNLVVMPGGIDIHSHIAGPAVDAARRIRPTVPSTLDTGYRYARLGYTTVMEAATPPNGARHTHAELGDIPIVDKGCYILMGNDEYIMKCLKIGEREKVRRSIAWLLSALKGYGIKLVNPGGVEQWKQGKEVEGLDDPIYGLDVTPRQILETFAWANEALGLPHPLHVHANRLGVPGNFRITIETMQALEGMRVHMAHLQFHSYGGKSYASFSSRAAEVAEYVNTHPYVTVDVGQVVFGEATTITADVPWQDRLRRLSGTTWSNQASEAETGYGSVPYTYREKNPVNAVQWAIGLELFLLIKDPWRVFLTTDHPNGGPFHAYPWVIKLLMDKSFRDEMLKRVHRRVLRETTLSSIHREYTLSEVAIITRAGPARALGLAKKGHLGVGADADIAIYPKDRDRQRMFENPVYIIKDGEVVVREGEVVQDFKGKTLFVVPPELGEADASVREAFEPISLESLPRYEAIPAGASHGDSRRFHRGDVR